ncbi:putative nucleic acid-binding regulator [Bradyrhizobium sp. STM 3843]|uniref:LysR family transcriptional regulator n=1 Tax=Bradyrhizobium sp. STM 3843 TaxID=551947 RepID=UPI0002406C34|nr:LysR family transcriptional regulator [Bradyrhizobium sp. STM 3843]CCE06214.1 putative nucleic acid-binding regulator [Bradyrhizobium sp. STM 3843]
MDRENASDLLAFLAVARERSFTRAAAKLRMSQPSLSQLILGLEERIGVRLLNRTTRSVTPTQVGERLLLKIGPKFDEIDQELAALTDLRDKPAGSIRISATDYSARMILMPALAKILFKYPDIKVEIVIDYGLTDIVANRFDAGIRVGGLLAKDMIAVRLGPDIRIAVVAAPAYLAGRKRPRQPQDLKEHNCINFRFMQEGGLFVWRFENGGRKLNVRVEGQLVFNDANALLYAALEGFGVAYLPEPYALPHLSSGELVRVLTDWCPSLPGYHLYYPSRRQPSSAFSVLVDAIRYRPGASA